MKILEIKKKMLKWRGKYRRREADEAILRHD